MRWIHKAASCNFGQNGIFLKNRLFSLALCVSFFLVFLPAAVFAGGKKEIITETADGIDIWQKEFNVSEMKPGTYNIIINARDAAGNVGVSGPFNIRIDPMAGLPEARVIYPEHGQVVREDISIVGVAAARYGVKKVLVKIDDEEYIELDGSDYWNYRVPAMDLVEGKHTIYVKAIDHHDLTGPESKIDFILDIVPPEIELIDRQIGDLIAGSVDIKGKVHDLNGIQSLSLSTDGENFSNLRLTKKRGDDSRYFQFPIRSKRYEDGPLVCYLRATNKTGHSITRPYLFFINNNPPQIEIISPDSSDGNIYGNTQVTGRVVTGVGLTAFYYEWAGERVNIPVRPGDPFWTVIFPISMANNRAVPFRVTAVDKSGNVTTVSQRFQDTRRDRTPNLAIDYPPAPGGLGRMNLGPDQPIYGHFLPGFFPYAIIIEGEVEYVMAQPSFRIDPGLIPEGRSTMRLWAIDEDDVTSLVPFDLRVNKAPRPEGFELTESPISIYSPEDYEWISDSVTVSGSVDGYSGQSLEYRLRWDKSWQPISVDRSGSFTELISLAGLDEGPVPMEFRTVRDGVGDYPLYLPVNKYSSRPVINFLVPSEQYGSIHGDVTTAGTIDYFVPLSEVSYSVDGIVFERMSYYAKSNKAWFSGSFDYSAMHSLGQKLVVRVVDRAGNTAEASPAISFDNSNDFPVIILNSPREGEIISEDFNISGLAFDDDNVAMVYWRILSPRNPWDPVEVTFNSRSDSEFQRFETVQNFLFPVSMIDLRDGENILELFAEDMYGVESEVIQRVFKVSTQAPVTEVAAPRMDIWNRGNIVVRGTAFDLNGIKDVLVSMDNGVSYQRAGFVSSQVEPSLWQINLNTKAYSDGVYSMLVRTIDNYGVSSFSNGVINIDNTPPEIDLGSPGNGDKIGVALPISGQVYDNFGVSGLKFQVVNIEDPNLQSSYELPEQFIIMESVDVSEFPDGDYTLKIAAFDQSGNETSIIRNFNILKARAASEVALINPMPGITHHGPVVVSGKITGAVIPERVSLLLDQNVYTQIDVNRYGIFHYDLPEDAVMTDNPVVFSASFVTPGGEQIVSFENRIKVDRYGPVLVIDSHYDGDVITQRPYISGRAYYAVPESEMTEEGTGRASGRAGRRAGDENPRVRKVELSFDNGRSFVTAEGREQWKFRLETGELERGALPIVIKAVFDDDSVAIRRILLIVDTRAPVVNTIGPPENSSHRSEIVVYGSTSDDFDMDTVEISLRPGDKAGYSVPGFIQGLYLDVSALGGLQYALGLGLTFFDDNVKLQFNASQAGPGSRYSGWAFGGKVLANVYTKNLSDWFGPDWEFYTTSLTLGAHFSYFLMEEGEIPLVMGQFLGQWEIIKADLSYFFPKWKYFKTISLYTEPGIWFAPSDVTTEQAWRTRFTIGFGGRFSLF